MTFKGGHRIQLHVKEDETKLSGQWHPKVVASAGALLCFVALISYSFSPSSLSSALPHSSLSSLAPKRLKNIQNPRSHRFHSDRRKEYWSRRERLLDVSALPGGVGMARSFVYHPKILVAAVVDKAVNCFYVHTQCVTLCSLRVQWVRFTTEWLDERKDTVSCDASEILRDSEYQIR